MQSLQQKQYCVVTHAFKNLELSFWLGTLGSPNQLEFHRSVLFYNCPFWVHWPWSEILLQPVAKMLRHLTRKPLFLPKHRIKSYISKIKQLPSPSPIFNVVLRKFQHDLLLWPTLRRERGGGLKCEGLISTLDVQIRYNVSTLFATGCLNAEVSCYSISRLS